MSCGTLPRDYSSQVFIASPAALVKSGGGCGLLGLLLGGAGAASDFFGTQEDANREDARVVGAHLRKHLVGGGDATLLLCELLEAALGILVGAFCNQRIELGEDGATDKAGCRIVALVEVDGPDDGFKRVGEDYL